MKFKALALVAALALVQPAFAQTIIDGTDINEVVNTARGYGSATLERESDDTPGIRGRIDGNPYYLSFRNCESEDSCEDFFFQSFFIEPEVDLALANDWNYEKRWTKLYFDSDDDAVLEMDVNMGGGITSANLDQAFSIWSQMMEQFFDDYLTKRAN